MAMDMSVAMRIAASVTGGSSVDDLRKSVDRLNTSANGIQGAFKTAGMMVKGFIGIEAVRQVASYGLELFKAADALDELSQRTGVSAEILSRLEQSAKMSGVSIDGVATGMKKLAVNLVEAQNGSKEAAKGFAALRLDPSQFRTSEEALMAIADRFRQMEDGANKVAIANALMGKTGEANIPWLNQGSEAMRKYTAVFTPGFIGMSAKFTDQLDEMGFNFRRTSAAVLEKFLPTLSQILDSFLALTATKSQFIGFFELISEGFRQIAALAQIVVAGIRQMLELVSTAYDASAFALSGQLGAAGARLKEGFANIIEIGKQGITQFKQLQKDSLLFGSGTTQEILGRQRAAAGANGSGGNGAEFKPDMSSFNTTGKAELEKIEKLRIQLEQANQKRMDEMNAVNMSTLEYQKLTAAREIDTKAAEAAVGMSESGKEALRQMTEEMKQQTAAAIELEYATKRTFEYGMKSALKTYVEDATNMAKQSQDLFSKAFKGMEDALVQFAMTGKLNFRDLANSIIADLIRIQVRQQMVGWLGRISGGLFGGGGTSASFDYAGEFGSNPFGFAKGGIMTSGGPIELKQYAAGGIANSPQMAIFGEGSMNEAYVPLPDGRSIPVTMKGGGNTNNVTVNVSVDGSNSNVQSSGTEAAQLGSVISKAVQGEILKQQRPGGLLYGR